MTEAANRDQFVVDLQAGRLVFFAGAGASFNSCAPMPDALLRASADCFLPSGGTDDLELVRQVLKGKPVPDAPYTGIQPEVFYEHLLSLRGDEETLFLWRVLSPQWRAQQSAPLVPNPNHLALARYAAHTGLPIFTTNFDTLFEDAAATLGAPAEVVTPTESTGRTLAELSHDPLRPGIVTIVKLHGSIAMQGRETLSSLHSTMQSIAVTNEDALALVKRCSAGRTLAFLGYSGCDIDYFPSLLNAALDPPPFWFNPVGDDVTNDRVARIGARELKVVPSQLFAELTPTDGPATRQVAVDGATLLDRLKSEQTVRLSDPQKTLLLGMCLASVGRSDAAAHVLERVLSSDALAQTPRDEALAHIHLARIEDVRSRYDASIAATRRAEAAIRRGLAACDIERSEADALMVRALYHRSMSSQLTIGPTIRLGDVRVDFRPNLLEMFLKLFAAVWVELRFWLARGRPGLRPTLGAARAAETSRVRALHGMNDHASMLIGRIGGFAEGRIVRRIPFVQGMLRWGLARLRRRAIRLGDYFVYAGAEKQLSRMDGEEPSDAYQMLRDPLNYALVRRDRGVRALHKYGRDLAIADFKASRDAAIACGSPATVIKAVAGLVACDADTDQDRSILSDALTSAQGRGFRRYEARVRAQLTLASCPDS